MILVLARGGGQEGKGAERQGKEDGDTSRATLTDWSCCPLCKALKASTERVTLGMVLMLRHALPCKAVQPINNIVSCCVLWLAARPLCEAVLLLNRLSAGCCRMHCLSLTRAALSKFACAFALLPCKPTVSCLRHLLPTSYRPCHTV